MESIDAKALADRMKTGERLLLLDVRESEELKGELGQMAHVVHIPLGQLAIRVNELSEKEVPVIAICKLGGRATRAAEFLESVGFKTVIVLDGGMTGWNEASLPVV